MANMTLDSLLNRAAAREQAKMDKLEIQLPGSEDTLVFQRMSDAAILKTVDEIAANADDTPLTSAMGSVDHLIYQSCPLLQNPELQKQLGCAEPWDAVEKVFTLPERNIIGEKLFAWLGVDALVSDAKNA